MSENTNNSKNSGAIIKTALVLGAVAILFYVGFIAMAVRASGG